MTEQQSQYEVTEAVAGQELPDLLQARGISNAQYHTLQKSLYPGASPLSVIMVIDYCQARELDPMKKPCHIVPMKVKDAQTGQEVWRDVIMPGIYEYRTTAQRTGEYLGQARPLYGEIIDYKGTQAPEWCEFTVYRWNKMAKQRGEYAVLVYFSEVVSESWVKGGKRGEKKPNSRWQKAPRQMLTKCAEAAALRMAFPDQLGGEVTMEEIGDVTSHGIRDIEPAAEGEFTEKPEGTQTDKFIEEMDAANQDKGQSEAPSESPAKNAEEA